VLFHSIQIPISIAFHFITGFSPELDLTLLDRISKATTIIIELPQANLDSTNKKVIWMIQQVQERQHFRNDSDLAT
jgi:hypothetical protein